MEFKDKLRKVRKEKGISQQALADAIYVSRSAIAKWENGLGHPNEDSMKALEEYFHVSKSFFCTENPELVIVEKNQKMRAVTLFLYIVFFICMLTFAAYFLLYQFGFRFSSNMFFQEIDDKVIMKTNDYDFVLLTDDTKTVSDGCYTYQRYGILYREADKYSYKVTLTTEEGENVGTIHCYEGSDGIHCLINWTITSSKVEGDAILVERQYRTNQIIINGEKVDIYLYKYFKIKEPIESIVIEDLNMVIVEQNPSK